MNIKQEFDDSKLKIAGIVVITIFVPFIVFSKEHFGEETNSMIFGIAITLLHAIILWTGNERIFHSTLRKFDIDKHGKMFLFLLVLQVIIFTCIVMGIGWTIENYFTPNTVDIHYFLRSWGVSLLISFAVMGIYFGINMVQTYSKSLEEKEKLRTENMEAQFQSLKDQMNPHFLFNSLNTLSSIIPEEPLKAVLYTEKLASVYRYILGVKDKKVITVKEELDQVEAYLYLLQIRFGESIIFDFDIPDASLNYFVIPLSIQSLIENAVKHNIASKKKPLKVKIYTNNKQIVVCNHIQPLLTPLYSTRTGLNNLNSRYKLLIDKPIVISENDAQFCVSIPLIEIANIS